jgi:phosphoribosylformimino-5-aminoimidazole carboxamide ribotide isomerase
MNRYLLVIPSIDIKDGKTVRVVQGIPELNCAEYGNDPVEMAKIWRAENAKMIHIVDFNALIDGSKVNWKIVEDICSSIIIPVEYAGGIRTLNDAERIFETGVSRIVISTLAFENSKLFIEIFEKFGPQKIAIGVDVVDNEIVTNGRLSRTGMLYPEFVSKMKSIGVKRFAVTDVSRNGVLGGPNLELTKNIAQITGGRITHSGGIRNKDELLDLQSLMELGVDSVIVGRALYENRFPCQKLWRVAESGIFN